jgi:predicted PurR-regulated permease PerM
LLALWVALVDFLPMVGGALAGIPTAVIAGVTEGLFAFIVTVVVFLVYQEVENHILNPIIMSKTVRINPLLVLVAVLIGANLGGLLGGFFGGFVAVLLAIPIAGSLQVIVREVWKSTDPNAPPPGSPHPIAAVHPVGTVHPGGTVHPDGNGHAPEPQTKGTQTPGTQTTGTQAPDPPVSTK